MQPATSFHGLNAIDMFERVPLQRYSRGMQTFEELCIESRERMFPLDLPASWSYPYTRKTAPPKLATVVSMSRWYLLLAIDQDGAARDCPSENFKVSILMHLPSSDAPTPRAFSIRGIVLSVQSGHVLIRITRMSIQEVLSFPSAPLRCGKIARTSRTGNGSSDSAGSLGVPEVES